MPNRFFACAVAAPMCLIATPLVADVMFDNTLDGTRATNPNAQSTFRSRTATLARSPSRSTTASTSTSPH